MLIDETGPAKGKEAEENFKHWLDHHNIPYLSFQQGIETFSPALKNEFSGKRPDFMVLIPYAGPIIIDVKYKKMSETNTYPIDYGETEKYSSMQNKFNLPIWFALSNELLDYKTWLWIPAPKVMELGIEKKESSKSREHFFPVPEDAFKKLTYEDSLGKLFS